MRLFPFTETVQTEDIMQSRTIHSSELLSCVQPQQKITLTELWDCTAAAFCHITTDYNTGIALHSVCILSFLL